MTILVDAKTRKFWIKYLRLKDEFVNIFQSWLPTVEVQCGKLIQVIRADEGREFISTKLKEFCDRRRIRIKYVAPYIHKENGIEERGWRTIVTMKDSLLIDNHLLLEFWTEAIDIACYLQNRLPIKY